MGDKKYEVHKIIIETNSDGIPQLQELNNPELTKITLVIDKTNVLLYEGQEFKNFVPELNIL